MFYAPLLRRSAKNTGYAGVGPPIEKEIKNGAIEIF